MYTLLDRTAILLLIIAIFFSCVSAILYTYINVVSDIEINSLPASIMHKHNFSVGKASWYDYSLNGEIYSLTHNTAASRNFKQKTRLTVTNLDNNKSVNVVVNDYGPDMSVYPNRIIDLSSHAFKQIADLNKGIIKVKITQ